MVVWMGLMVVWMGLMVVWMGLIGRLDGIDGRLDGIDEQLGGHDKHLGRIDNSLGVLKGGHARGAALRDTALIADSMGFDLLRRVPQHEIISLPGRKMPRRFPKTNCRVSSELT